MTWNADKPAVGNQISADIADIEENLQELHDVIEAITDGTLGTTTASDFKVKAATSPAIWLQRSKFVWKDADEIYIYAGAYHHAGTKTQVVYWNSALTSDIGAPDASDWYYLYLDDSAIVTAGTNLLTATEFVWSNTEPAWSDAKHGWYNGSDRCIFAVLTDGSSNIVEFFHDGGEKVIHAGYITSVSGGTYNTSWLDVDFAAAMPKFSTKGEITLSSGSTALYYWRVNGQTDTVGHIGQLGYNDIEIITDSSQLIELKTASEVTISVLLNAWYFPAGV